MKSILHSAILLICIKQIIGLENQFSVFLEWPFYTGFTVLTDVSREATIVDPNQTAPTYKIQETLFNVDFQMYNRITLAVGYFVDKSA